MTVNDVVIHVPPVTPRYRREACVMTDNKSIIGYVVKFTGVVICIGMLFGVMATSDIDFTDFSNSNGTTF